MTVLEMIWKDRTPEEFTMLILSFIFVILVAVLYFSVAQIDVPEDDKNKRVVNDAQRSFMGIWVMIILIAILIVMKILKVAPITFVANKLLKRA